MFLLPKGLSLRVGIHCLLLLLVIAGAVAMAWQPDSTVRASPDQHPGGRTSIGADWHGAAT